MALRLGHRADRRRGDRRDSARSLRFGCRLLGRSQRWLVWNDHPLVSSHWSTGSRGCRGSRVLKKKKKKEFVCSVKGCTGSNGQLRTTLYISHIRRLI